LSKLVSVEDAIGLIKDGDTIFVPGFTYGTPEELLIILEKKFLETGHPKDLTVAGAGAGNVRGGGWDHLAHRGLIKKIYTAYLNLTPRIQKMVLDDEVECYMVPGGIMGQIASEIGRGGPGVITDMGLKTFIDPRLEGGKMNSISKEEMAEIIEIHGKEWLLYKTFHVDIAFVKGTTADEVGNISFEKEPGYQALLPMAIAAHNCGGKVIVQVERITVRGGINPQRVIVPGILVDVVIVAKPENHWQTWRIQYDPARSGEVRIPSSELRRRRPPISMGKEKVVARRGLYELEPGKVVNLGAGMSEYVSTLALEEGIYDKITLTVEAGMIGGIPGFGLSFNTAINPDAIIDMPYQMSLYEGGGNDITFLGFAQIDKDGNINVSKLGDRIPGVGGFLDVAPHAKKRVHCGSFTAGKSEVEIRDGKVEVVKDGKIKKFVDRVNQVTVSGEHALELGQPVSIITERGVFEWTGDGFVLKEIAPGIDLERQILDKMEFEPIISDDLKEMPKEIFEEAPLNLREKYPWNSKE